MQDEYPAREVPRREVYASQEESEETEIEYSEPQLPGNGLLYSISIGVLAGLLALAIPVVLTLINAALYVDASHLGDRMPVAMATSIAELACTALLIDLAICFVCGLIVGRVAVKRRLGFVAGIFAGAVYYLGNFLVLYIPGYPNQIPPTASKQTISILQGIGAVLLFVVVSALIAGLVSLWGTWTATRRHPYYLQRARS